MCIYAHSAIKKNEILLFVMTWTELETIMISEISQSDKDKQHMISFTCGIKETKQMNEKGIKRIPKILSIENKLVVTRGEVNRSMGETGEGD